MKHVKYIVVHCTQTPQSATLNEVKNHFKKNGAHHILQTHPYIIRRDGEIRRLYYYTAKKTEAAAHLPSPQECIYIIYTGGVDREGKPTDNRTQRQEDALFDKLVELSEKYPAAAIVGYSDIQQADVVSPCFDVKKWLANYKPDFLEKEYETEYAA